MSSTSPSLIESPEETLSLIKEILPRTLRSLFVLRISLCAAAILLALCKILLTPPVSTFFVDILSDGTTNLPAWIQTFNFVFSGLLATCLALIVSTFLIQARLRSKVDKDLAEMPARP